MSPVAFAVWLASDFTSLATTAKPRPAAPARAASIVALSASSEVWAATPSISLTTVPMRSAASARLRTVRSVRPSWLDGAVGRDLGGGDFAAGARDQRQQRTRGIRDRADVARGDFRRVGGVRGARVHVLVAAAEVGGGDLDLLAGLVEGADQLVDRRAEALGEERAAGMVQLGLGLAAALVDRERVGVDQRLAHPLGAPPRCRPWRRRRCAPAARRSGRRRRCSVIASTTERSRRSIHQAAASAARPAAARPAIPFPVRATVAAGSGGGKEHRQQNPPGRNRLASLNCHRKMNSDEIPPAPLKIECIRLPNPFQ